MDIRERVGVGRIGRLRLTYIYYHLVGSCYKAQKAQLGAPEAGAGWGGHWKGSPRGDIGMHMADLLDRTTETNTTF